MDINVFTSEEEIKKKVKTRIKRAVKSMHKACTEISEQAKCNGCPFKTWHGCTLYGHPLNWDDKIKELDSK